MRRPEPAIVHHDSPEPAPELTPAARNAIAWLAKQPDAAKLLGPLAEPEPVEPRQPRRREAENHQLTTPFAELSAKAAALAARVDKLVVRDDRWERLKQEGYTVEAMEQIARFASEQGISDPHEAARALERAIGYPEPVVSSGRRHFHTLDRAEAAKEQDAYAALLSGDDERFLEMTIPGYRSSSW